MKKALIIGEGEMVKEALMERLKEEYVVEVAEVDLMEQEDVAIFIHDYKPDHVFFTGGYWFGLMENEKHPAELGFNNAQIIMNIIFAVGMCKVPKTLFISSSCIYPPSAPQPLKEDSLMSGLLEPISEPSALARIWGHKLFTYFNKQYETQFVTVVPAGMYGPADDFCPETGHVLPALIERFSLAKEQGLSKVTLWGSGKPLREWIHVEDVADACVFAMEHCDNELANITDPAGELSIMDLAVMVAGIVGYEGGIDWDRSKPDGAYRKALDGSKLYNLGWKPKISLREGIERTVKWYQENPRVEV